LEKDGKSTPARSASGGEATAHIQQVSGIGKDAGYPLIPNVCLPVGGGEKKRLYPRGGKGKTY